MKFTLKVTDGDATLGELNFVAKTHSEVEKLVEEWHDNDVISNIEAEVDGWIDVELFQNILKIEVNSFTSQKAYVKFRELILSKFKTI